MGLFCIEPAVHSERIASPYFLTLNGFRGGALSKTLDVRIEKTRSSLGKAAILVRSNSDKCVSVAHLVGLYPERSKSVAG